MSIETLLKGIKPRALENDEFEYRKNEKPSHFSQFSAYHEAFVAGPKIQDFQFEDPSKDRKLPIHLDGRSQANSYGEMRI